MEQMEQQRQQNLATAEEPLSQKRLESNLLICGLISRIYALLCSEKELFVI